VEEGQLSSDHMASSSAGCIGGGAERRPEFRHGLEGRRCQEGTFRQQAFRHESLCAADAPCSKRGSTRGMSLGSTASAIIGRREEGATFTIPKEPVRRRMHGIETLNVLRGGEYFFMPNIRSLKWLANVGERRRPTMSDHVDGPRSIGE
jgi:hypothetical protein